MQIYTDRWLGNSDTPIDLTFQKAAKIAHLLDRWFEHSYSPQFQKRKLAKIENLQDSGFGIFDTPMQTSLEKQSNVQIYRI